MFLFKQIVSNMTNIYRYPGLLPYTFEQNKYYCGRTKDIEKLSQIVNLERLVILHSKPQVGKTSLINAGLLPNIDDIYYPIHIDFSKNKYSSLNELFIKTLAFDFPIHSALQKIDFQEDTQWYYVKNLHYNLPPEKRLLFIFDSFDSIFQYSDDEILEFKQQFSELLYTKVPQNFRNVISKHLEEDSYMTDNELNTLFTQADFRVLLVVNSDKLNLLNRLNDYIPGIIKNCYELIPLTLDQLKGIIRKSAAIDCESVTFTYNLELLSRIITYLSKIPDTQQLPVLQMICYTIERIYVFGNNYKELTNENIPPITELIDLFYNIKFSALGFDKKSERKSMKMFDNLLHAENQTIKLPIIIGEYHLAESSIQNIVKIGFLKEVITNSKISYKIANECVANLLLMNLQKLKRIKQLKNTVLITSVLSLIFISLFCYALYQKNRAENESEIKQTLLYAAKADVLIEDNQLNALQLATYCFDQLPTHNFIHKIILKAYYEPILKKSPYPNLTFKAHDSYINSLAFSPNGKYLLSSSSDRKIKMWLLTGKPLQEIDFTNDEAEKVAFSEKGDKIYAFTRDSVLWMSNLYINYYDSKIIKNNEIDTFFKKDTNKFDYSFIGKNRIGTQNKMFVATSGNDFCINLWNKTNLKIEEVPKIEYKNLINAFFTSNSENIVTVSLESAALWDLNEQKIVDFKVENTFFSDFKFSNDSKNAVAISDTNLFIFNKKGELLNNIDAHKSRINQMQISSDNKFVITCSDDSTLKIWNLNGKIINKLKHCSQVEKCLFFPNNQKILTVTHNNTISLWGVNGDSISKRKEKNTIHYITVSKDGEYIAVCTDSSSVLIYNTLGQHIFQFIGPQSPVEFAEFTNDKKKLLTKSFDGTVYCWSINEKKVASIPLNTKRVLVSEFSNDDQFIVTVSDSRVLTLWSENGESIFVYPKLGDYKKLEYAPVLNFSRDNNRFLTVINNNSVLIWLTPKGVHNRVNEVDYMKIKSEIQLQELLQNND